MRGQRIIPSVSGILLATGTMGVAAPPPNLPPHFEQFQTPPKIYDAIVRHDQQLLQARHASSSGGLRTLRHTVLQYGLAHPLMLLAVVAVLVVVFVAAVRFGRGW